MAHEPVYCLHGASTQAKVSRVSQDPAKALAVPVGGSVIPLPLRAGRPSEIRIRFASTGSRAYSLLEPLSKGRIVYRKFRIAADRRTQPAAFVAGGEGEGGQGVPELIIAIRRKAFTTEAQRARRKIRSKKSPGLRGEFKSYWLRSTPPSPSSAFTICSDHCATSSSRSVRSCDWNSAWSNVEYLPGAPVGPVLLGAPIKPSLLEWVFSPR